MRDFALDENGDILVTSNDIAIVSGEEQEIQKIRQVLGTRSGEWLYDKNEGIDLDTLMQKEVNLQQIREIIQNALYEINEHYVLQNCRYEIQNRVLHITVSGEKQIPLEVYVPVNTKS